MDRRQFVTTVGAVAAGATAGCTGMSATGDVATEVVEDTFEPADVNSVGVDNTIGDVVVRAQETDEVSTRVVKRSTNGDDGLDDIRTSATLSEGTLTVQASIRRNSGWFSRNSPSTDVTVTVPEGDAAPSVDEVTSRLGDIALLDTRGDTEVRTELGNVTARRVDGYPSLESALGNVVATGTTGLGGVATELGNVDLELLNVRDDLTVRTELGDILVNVASDLAVDVVAISNGRISSDLSLTDTRRRDNRLSGRLNGGGPEVRVTTELGDVSLQSLGGE